MQQARPRRLAGAAAAIVPALLFGVRLAVAVNAALFIGFYLQLENPSWAGTSAAIVCQPILGASLRKGLFRLVGTTVGAIATVLLTACFPQDRLGFLLGLALWCAACSFLSTVLRNFAAYAAMLAGYTMAIIASSSILAPENVFTLALSRATEITVGIVCGMVVMSITDLGASQRRLANSLSDLIGEIGAGLTAQLRSRGGSDEAFRQRRRQVLKRVAALDPLLDQTIGESPAASERRTVLRTGIHGLFLALAAWRTIGVHLQHLRPDEAATTTDALLDHLPDDMARPFDVEGGRSGAIAMAARAGRWFETARSCRAASVSSSSLRLALDRIGSVLDGLGRSANALVLLADGRLAMNIRAVPKNFMPDALPPLVNAARVFITIGAGALFYVATSWDSGPTFITFLAVTVLLQSPRDEAAVSASIGFGAGTVLTALVAAVIKFAVLPNHESFTDFALITSLALVPMAALSTVPSLSAVFIAATANFIPLLAPTNQISFDTLTFYNNALAIVGGSIAGTVILRVIPPVPTRVRAHRLLGLTLRDLRRLARHPGRWTPDQWRSRIFARLMALPPDAEPVDGSRLLACLTVGLQLVDLAAAAAAGRDPAALDPVTRAVSRGDVEAARQALRTVRPQIGAWAPGEADRATRLRLQGAARELSSILNSYADYFGARLT